MESNAENEFGIKTNELVNENGPFTLKEMSLEGDDLKPGSIPEALIREYKAHFDETIHKETHIEL